MEFLPKPSRWHLLLVVASLLNLVIVVICVSGDSQNAEVQSILKVISGITLVLFVVWVTGFLFVKIYWDSARWQVLANRPSALLEAGDPIAAEHEFDKLQGHTQALPHTDRRRAILLNGICVYLDA